MNVLNSPILTDPPPWKPHPLPRSHVTVITFYKLKQMSASSPPKRLVVTVKPFIYAHSSFDRTT